MQNSSSRSPFNIEFTGTPEAGKTTQFKRISELLRKEGYNITAIRETAEIVPSCFGKGSIDSNRWIGLKTAEELLCANASDADIVIIDRGLIDRLIWQEIYLSNRLITMGEAESQRYYFEQFIPKPDILFVFSIPPDLSIERRGGEGIITTKSFVSSYNSQVDKFLRSYSGKFFNIDAELSIDEVSQMLMNLIHCILPN